MNKKGIFKEILPYIVIIVVVVLIRSFIVTPVKVDGTSMVPNLNNNEILLLKKYDKSFKRFDIVVFKHQNSKLIKRIIGLPGEIVEYKDNKLFINGKFVDEKFKRAETADFDIAELDLVKIPKNKYFVMGDNRVNSVDSRIIGVIDKSQIDGETDLSIFPFKKIN